MTIQSIAPITEEQKKRYLRFVEDAAGMALREVGLDKKGLVNLIKSGDKLQSRIVAAIRELSQGFQFVDEESPYSRAYPIEYKNNRVIEQVAVLREFFPELAGATFNESIAARPLPYNAERWFAIPRWDKIGSSYGEAVGKVLAAIASSRRFYNFREGKRGPEYLRQLEKTAKACAKLGDEQKGHDILISACQFGLRHRGRSARRAREAMLANEFGLGVFAVGCMILAHPEREVRWDHLHVDCAGDEYAPDADSDFSGVPSFRYGPTSMLEFSVRPFDRADQYFGSASGFLLA